MALDFGLEHPQSVGVTKRFKYNEGNTSVVSNSNPVLDTRVYEVDYEDVYRLVLASNVISENLFSQVYKQRTRHRLIQSVIDIRANGQEVNEKESFLSPIMDIKHESTPLVAGKYVSNGRLE